MRASDKRTMIGYVLPVTHPFRKPRRHPTQKCSSSTLSRQPAARLVELPTGVVMEVIEKPNLSFTTSASSPVPFRNKPPLLFIHGALHGAWCYHLFQDFYSKRGFDTYAVSLRGATGTKGDTPGQVTLEQHIADLTAVCHNLNFPSPPIIVGHSLGGFVAQKWVELSEDLEFCGMVLIASSPPSGNSKLVWRILSRDGLWRTARITLGFVRRSASSDLDLCREMFFSHKSQPWFSNSLEGDAKLLEYMDLFKLTGPLVGRKCLKKVVQDTARLKGNVFVIGGSSDAIVDLKALEETAELWNGDLKVIDNAPHDLMLYSEWESVAQSIADWIDTKLLS